MRNTRANLKLIDDIARVATGALGSLGDIRAQVRRQVRERVEQVMERMDLVTREEFEAVEAMAVKAREENEALAKRLAALEGKAGTTGKESNTPRQAKSPRKRPAADEA